MCLWWWWWWGCWVGIREQKDPSLSSKRICSRLIPCSVATAFYFSGVVVMAGGRREDGIWWESLMAGDADFKVIFNFKPCRPHEMKPSAPDTVLPMAPSGNLPRLLFFSSFPPQALSCWHSSGITHWPDDQMKEFLWETWKRWILTPETSVAS